MYDFYEDFYKATQTSAAHAELCERAYGRNFAQHGFADMAQLDFLISVAGLEPGSRVLDLGCGNGSMAEYVSDVTGAHITGIDFSPTAIRQAQARTQGKEHRLAFQVGDISALPFPSDSFDCIISVDTLYFGEIDELLSQLRDVLSPSGQIVAYFTHAAHPGIPIPGFPRETLPPDLTPLAEGFRRQGFAYQAWDFSDADRGHEAQMRDALIELEAQFQREGNSALFKYRLSETNGVTAAIEAGCHARYLYQARKQER
jgi:ubiquinone/menaquinone biosynthesis C-methylase UbiE